MAPRGKRALPTETDAALSNKELIQTLRLLSGEEVCVKLTLAPGGSRLTIKGKLSLYDYLNGVGAAVGTARLLLLPDPEMSARLWTFDGNDFFQLTIRFGDHDVIVGDPGSLATDEFDA